MDPLDHIPADAAREDRRGFRVTDDLAGRPVSDAEIDVVEAFLKDQLAAVMAGQSLSQAGALDIPDSNTPQTHAGIAVPAKVRRRGQ